MVVDLRWFLYFHIFFTSALPLSNKSGIWKAHFLDFIGINLCANNDLSRAVYFYTGPAIIVTFWNKRGSRFKFLSNNLGSVVRNKQ